MTTLRIGGGSAYANDRLEPVRAMAGSGAVTYMGFDCLAERTMALAQVRRRDNPQAGQDERIAEIVPAVSQYLAGGGRIVGNFGAANPQAAFEDFSRALHKSGLGGVRLGVITGDDVRDVVKRLDVKLPELGTTAAALGDRLVSANAYIGAEPIVGCLREQAQIVLGGRLADPSLFVGPICHEMDWDLTDWDRVGMATLAGHLLECGVHGTGGNFEDPPYRMIPNPHDLGFPIGEISEGSIVITKLPGSGGAVDERIIKTQLYYEIHNPAEYLTPDVTADFTGIVVEDLGNDRVRVSGATGRPRPETLKVLVGVDQGWKSVAEISYGGPGCVERARRAAEIVRSRIAPFESELDDFRIDLTGLNSLFGNRMAAGYPAEVRLRVASRSLSLDCVRAVAYEVEYLYFGPAGGGGVTSSVVPALGVTPAYVSRDEIPLSYEVLTA